MRVRRNNSRRSTHLKLLTAITDTKLRDKLMKETNLELKKTLDMIIQNTYEWTNWKNTKPKALITNREKETKEPIQKIGKIRYGFGRCFSLVKNYIFDE